MVTAPDATAGRGGGKSHQWACTIAQGWFSEDAPSAEPPYELPQEFAAGCEEVLLTLEDCAWIFPPYTGEPRSRRGAKHVSTVGSAIASASASVQGTPGTGLVTEERPDILIVPYQQQLLKSERAQKVVQILLNVSTGDKSRGLYKALARFAAEAYDVLLAMSGGKWVIPEEDRVNLVHEAGRAMQMLVVEKHISVPADLVLSLEAFGVSKGRAASEQDWLCKCLGNIIEKGINAANPEQKMQWCDMMRSRMQGEAGELYSSIDVRAWPHILKLVNTDFRAIEKEAFHAQVRLQLCMQSKYAEWYQGLQLAAKLISDLRQADAFGEHELREIFNDRLHFERQKRHNLLSTVLKGAPRCLIQDVLRNIDGEDVDISERDDEEVLLIRDLISSLREDIRCCKHAFFKMKSDWIAARWSGVVFHEELSPEQVCDHIEHEDNHEELLKIAVNRLLRTNSKFQAAKMLSRGESASTRVFETNRNDKQLAYLVSLYQEMEPPRDRFGPVEELALVLPCAHDQVLYVKDCGEALQRVERETLTSQRPMAIGLWWFWRCFDPKLDFWPRAALLALAYEDSFVLVDFLRLENGTDGEERRSKDVVKRILQAPHLLKVVHDLDSNALQVLQRAVLPQLDLNGEAPEWPILAPVLDLTVAVAYTRNTKPCSPAASKIHGLSFNYLRLELCLAEALSNFERRPLRQTQQHYALTLAWCPLMILRALCAYEILKPHDVKLMALQLGLPDVPARWDQTIRSLSLAAEAHAGPGGDPSIFDEMIGGDLGRNLWEDESAEAQEWRDKLPRPQCDLQVRFRGHLEKQYMSALVTKPDSLALVGRSLERVFDRPSAARDLEALYRRYDEHQEERTQGL